jgi:hypothetical protein
MDVALRPGARRGSALVVVLLALLLMSAVAAAMLTLATADTMAAANERDARVALYAAESAIERAADEIVGLSDWDGVLAGLVQSARADGAPSGPRRMPDGRTIQLEQLPNLASCGLASGCTASALAAVTADRPWGANNPRWRLFAYGPTPGASPSFPSYSIVMVADDPMESDGNPDQDAAPGTPGAGVVLLRAEAYGPAGARRIIEAAVAKVVSSGGVAAPKFLSWWPDR